MTGIDFDKAPPAGGFLNNDGMPTPALAADEIALNSWAADDLQAKIGDPIRVTYFEPESTHGRVREHTVELRLAAILPLSGAADDANLTPTLPGVTDQLSIADWNPPFPFDSQRVRPRDEEYWDKHKATPKAFVALATGGKLWGSRFGDTTSLRIPAAAGARPTSWPSACSRCPPILASNSGRSSCTRSRLRPAPRRFSTCSSASAFSSSWRRSC